MPIDITILDGHMARVFTDFPLVAYWQGKAINAVRSQPMISQTLEIGGPDTKVEFDLFLRASELPRLPKEGDMFVVGGVKMKVVTIRNSAETGELICCGMGYARGGEIV
jgi:hypothetical protein